MYHLRLKGSHYEMGVKRGKIFNRGRVSFPLRLDAFQLEHGRKSEKILRSFFPEVCEEIRGVSDTAGADYLYFASWMLCMGCCMYNLEQNIPVEIRGCTAFAYVKGEKVIYGRNNDLPPYLRKGSKSEIYAPDGGSRFQITTSSFINGEEGLNEHGLAVAMTFVMTDTEKILPGFNSCFIVRYLLEKAEDTGQAIALLNELPVASNCNILLADKKRTREAWTDLGILELVQRIRSMEQNDLNEWITWFSNVIRELNEGERRTLIQQLREGDEKAMCSSFGQLLDKEKAEGRAEGKAEGRAEGIAEGRAEGKAEGRTKERAEAVIELLEEIGEPSQQLREYIMEQTELEVLRRWHRAAAKSESIEDFEQAVGLAPII